MNTLLLSFLLLCTPISIMSGDTEILKPNICSDMHWNMYEDNRTTPKSILSDVGEVITDICKSIKHWFLLDLLVFKNNKIETEQAKEILRAFNVDPKNVTILHKPLIPSVANLYAYTIPSTTLFNTIIVDHNRFKKLSADEQAFLLGKEIIRLKNMDYITKPLALLALLISGTALGEKTYGISILLLPFLIPKLSRWQEKRIDIESAKTLTLAAAGASAFRKMQQKYISDQEVPLNPNNFIYRLQSFFGLFSMQPDLHERIEYLQDLAQEQAAEAQ